MTTATDRAAAYVAKMPPAIAGSGGHAATFAVACKLVEFGLGESDAMQELQRFNSRCEPPWTEADLRHKLDSARRHTAPKPDLADARQSAPAWRPVPTPAPQVKRPSLPVLRSGTAAEIGQLAALRSLGPDCLRLAEQKGLLRFGEFHGAGAWFILDRSGRVAQARRLDGRKWGERVKAWTLTGSQAAWPVGTEESAPFPVIAWCEGGPDLLAACQFILAENRAADVAPVAMLGGCARIHPDALPQFAGKRVEIFQHLDETGADATNRWAEQLASVGAAPRYFDLSGLHRADGEPVKDLNDLAQISADDFESDRSLWSILP